jgi:hypothetical protein
MLENVTKEYTMTKQLALLHITQAIIAVSIIFISWGFDAPIHNFALVFGGFLLGHVLTEALNFVEGDDE